MTIIDRLRDWPRYEKRRFLGEHDQAGNLEIIDRYFRILNDKKCHSREDLEEWILNRSEWEAAIDQAGTILYIAMTCQTDDQASSAAYQDFITEVVPGIQRMDDALNRKFVEEIKTWSLDQDWYRMYSREIEVGIELFREENIPLETEVSLLTQEYQKICGAMTVDFDGQEQTMPRMSKYLQEPDRLVRESAWRSMSARRLRDRDLLEDVFDKLKDLRGRMARNAGFTNYMDYKFKSLCRFDYTPEDCRKYHDAVERCVVPLWNKILRRRRKEMGVSVLRPWDLAVDPFGRPALQPFRQISELVDGCQKIFARIDPDLGLEFSAMSIQGALDLDSRKGKAPGGYQSALAESRRPFIFMNAVGVDSDIWTLLHEAGHAFHVNATAALPIHAYRHAPMEFCEVASMSMEMLGMNHLQEFYSPEEEQRSRRAHLEGVIWTLQWVATIDAFQQWIYLNPGHTSNERCREWIQIRKRFGGSEVDWSGLDEENVYAWHQQLHIFEVPFYYIEYAIAQLGALQLWRNARLDLPRTVSQYKEGLALGGSVSLSTLYETAGIRFDFSVGTMQPLMEDVRLALGFS
jgi:oligoendopeptidase F